MKYKGTSLLEKKCLAYIRENLKAPPHSVVIRWGKKLGLEPPEIKKINDRLHLRAHLGPDPGFLSNTKNWKKTTPRSFRSPYYAQGDIGNIFSNIYIFFPFPPPSPDFVLTTPPPTLVVTDFFDFRFF
jgi:hypothetical protein